MEYGEALLKEGNPHCSHVIMIRWERGKEIGRCCCGRVVNYTLMQQRIPELKDWPLFRANINMDKISGIQKPLKRLKHSEIYTHDSFFNYCDVYSAIRDTQKVGVMQ